MAHRSITGARASRGRTLEPLESRRLLAAVAWTGSGDGTRWSQPLNWSTFEVPGAGDDVSINVSGSPTILFDSTAGSAVVKSLSTSETLHVSGGSLKVTGAMADSAGVVVDGGTLTVGSLNVNKATTVIRGSGHLAGGAITVANTATFELDTSIAVGSLHVLSGGVVTHAAGSKGFNLKTAGDVTIDSGGKITADGKGFAKDSGPGKGSFALNTASGGGGGYGAKGGDGSVAGGAAYGSATLPVDLGSGGGSWQGAFDHHDGGAGGGLIHIEAGGKLTVDGTLSANGLAGSGALGNGASGGGSGGTVYLKAASIVLANTVSAHGGDGGFSPAAPVPGATNIFAGGGAGGRIAVYFGALTISGTGKFNVNGGNGGHAGGLGSLFSQKISTTPSSISGNVFKDANANGAKDSGEANFSAFTLYIDSNRNGRKDAGEPTAATDGNGNYKFSGLTAGSYRVRAAPPSGYHTTFPKAPAPWWDVVLSAGQNATGKNFGESNAVGALSGNVFKDNNHDGVKDTGDTNFGAFKLYIDANRNGLLDAGERTAFTDANGNYKFAGLAAGITYRVRAAPPSGWHTVLPKSPAPWYEVAVSANATSGGKNFGEST